MSEVRKPREEPADLPWLEEIDGPDTPGFVRLLADDFMERPLSNSVVIIAMICSLVNFTFAGNVDRGLLWLILAVVAGRR